MRFDLLCLSHLRWDFVYQRPHHLLSRFARSRRVFFVEEPRPLESGEPRLDVTPRADGLRVVVPRLPARVTGIDADLLLARLLDELVDSAAIQDAVHWYYTPMALRFTHRLPRPLATVYDCMDQLSAFRGAAPDLVLREAELLQRADLVFTGGPSLHEAKQHQHRSVHCFPSSVDVEHFAGARQASAERPDQANLPHPRLGFFGVLDERLDTDLLAAVADLRSEWHLVLVGPVAKIDPADLPRRRNIHYLGPKSYAELPRYLAGWDVALLPFARNEATRYISPTKTPEYLAAGRPVVSTSIRDVVQPYGEHGLVRIADEPAAFVRAVDAALNDDPTQHLRRVDAFLDGLSWDRTWAAMDALLSRVVAQRYTTAARVEQAA